MFQFFEYSWTFYLFFLRQYFESVYWINFIASIKYANLYIFLK